MSGGKVIAIAWLTFAMLIVAWGGLWIHVAVPILACVVWLSGVMLIVRRKTS